MIKPSSGTVKTVVLRFCVAKKELFNALIGIELLDMDKNSLLKAEYANANLDFFRMHIIELAEGERILGFRSAGKGN